MTPSFVIREPTPADVPALVRVHVETWRSSYSDLLPVGFFTEQFTAGRTRMWTNITSNPRPDRRLRVAELEGTVIGFALAGSPEDATSPRPLQLYSIYVDLENHGTGAGQALLDAVLGDSPAVLWVAERNPRARAFYERNGFRLDGERQIEAATPDLVEVRMVR